MTKELSALLDGELEVHEAPALWSSVRSDKMLGRKWSEYQLISDAIRQEDSLETDIVARVMGGLESEPTILAPRAVPRQARQQRPGAALALAASVAGVAVVGWLAFTPQGGLHEVNSMARAPVPTSGFAQVARMPPAGPTVAQTLASPATLSNEQQAASDYRQYLLAHQANAAGLYMQGGAQHIRTVSSIGAVQ
jgi:negative regulator of sigma E activity